MFGEKLEIGKQEINLIMLFSRFQYNFRNFLKMRNEKHIKCLYIAKN